MLKTKLLFSLGTLGVIAGTGSVVYYGVNKSDDLGVTENFPIEGDTRGSKEVDKVETDRVERPDENLGGDVGQSAQNEKQNLIGGEPSITKRVVETQVNNNDGANPVNNEPDPDLTFLPPQDDSAERSALPSSISNSLNTKEPVTSSFTNPKEREEEKSADQRETPEVIPENSDTKAQSSGEEGVNLEGTENS